MTTKTFWIILIKILGLSILLSTLTVIPEFFSTLYFTFKENGSTDFTEISFFLVLILIIYLLILRFCVFKPEWIISKLKLERNLEERIELNIKTSTILNISIAVIGGITFIGSIPMLCETLYEFFRQDSLFIDFDNSKWIVAYFLKALLGFLIFTNSKTITKIIFKQTEEIED